MSRYYEAKEIAREEAITWQQFLSQASYSYAEMQYFNKYFNKMAKRYGLLKEFRENGVI